MADLDRVLALARLPEVTLVTFGDLIRVPASRGTLAAERAAGADVRVVYSPRDAVRIAADEPDRQVVFAGIGFETTAPTTAAALLEARAAGLANFSLLSLHKTMPLPLRALLDLGETPISGFLLPGHVSVITGTACYEFLASDYGIAGVVAGFEARDVLEALLMLVRLPEARHRHPVHAGGASRGQRGGAAPAGAGVRAERRRLARPRRHPRVRAGAARGVRRRRRRAPVRRRPGPVAGAAGVPLRRGAARRHRSRRSAPCSARAARRRTRSAPAW